MWIELARRFGLGLTVLTGEDQYAASALNANSITDKIAECVLLLPKSSRHPLLVDAIELQLINNHVLPTKEQGYLGILALVSGGRMSQRDMHLDDDWNDTEEFRCVEGNDTLAGMMLEHGKCVLFRPSSP